MNGLIAIPYVPAAVSTTTDTAAGWPVANVITRQPRRAAVFEASPAGIDIDLGEARDVGLVGLVSTDATHWEVRAAATQLDLDSAGAIVDESVTPGAGVQALFWDGALREERWWRIAVSGVPDFRVGRIVLAKGFQPDFNFEFGGTRGHAPGWEIEQAAGGAIYPTGHPQRRRWALTYGDITDEEYSAELEAIDAYTAGGGEVLFVRDPDPENDDRMAGALYGLMRLAQGATRVRQNRWRAPITLEELT